MTNETKIESGGNLRTETAVAKQVARYQPLFDLLYQEHGITPLESEMQEIINVALATRAPQQAAGELEMSGAEYLRVALGGNMNTLTLTPLAISELMDQYAGYVGRAPQQAAGEWVSVEGELPPEAKIARKPIELGWLVCDAVGKVYITKQHPTNWNTVDPRGYEFNGDPVSHWMPLPKPTANAGEAGDDQICKCAASSGNWFDRTISHRSDGTEGMAYVCNDCGNEVSTAGEGRG